MHIIAAKAVAFGLALRDEFVEYQKQVVSNAKHFSKCMEEKKYRIVSGGTDTHLFLVDLRPKNITGKDAVGILSAINITVNKNLIPFDDKPPAVSSGIRIGSPAVTSRGMKEKEMEKICSFLDAAITDKDNGAKIEEIKKEVTSFTSKFPLYESLKM
jgi:glycine hydroxymethyltransferase